ncbi:hypothetical protein TRAPUB_2328 [Trametes pubescens]|uniref:Protein kinase domain-containing protein n=1 Tax=Trametes pubescens TaxID=154538 RepID=A0A1M2VGU8_TRAPU|nr:hypothetical protein TRAPUB_2328 [Trametes pubescens]
MPAKDTKNPKERIRDVRLWWERNPDGPIIPRTLPPAGIRTMEGFVWGHTLEHLFWIQRIPKVNAVTIWSRSMLEELGEGYDEHQWDEPLVEPRAIRPWPVLKLTDGHDNVSSTSPPIGAIDGGCACEHAEQVEYQIRPDEVYVKVKLEEVDSGVPPEPASAASDKKPEDAGSKDTDVQMIDADAATKDGPSQLASELALAEDKEGTAAKEAVGTEDASMDEGAASAADESATSSADESAPSEDESASPEDLASSAKGKEKQTASLPSLPEGYSVIGLPKLEELIPTEFFPDVLIVHDPENTTNQQKKDSVMTPIKYIRQSPLFKRDEEGSEPRVAHLYMAKQNRIGTGNHSYVYRAPLTLPAPLSAHSSTGQVTVAAKLAYPRCTAHNLLRNEGRVYDTFPTHIQEEYCGYNIVPQCRFPVPATAIVPKFYGYYLPVNERGEVVDHRPDHEKCSERSPCTVNWPSPILLMEECGEPVEPSKFTIDQRTECFSLILRLHYLEIVQGSFYVRNIMIQPGPLTVPPEKRSYDTPSFRIIDFGRGESWEWHLETARRHGSWRDSREKIRRDFMARVGDELHRARKELLIDDFGF